MQALPYDGSVQGWSPVLQEFLIEELARRAFDITAKSNRDMISYTDVGEYWIGVPMCRSSAGNLMLVHASFSDALQPLIRH